jgi:hypothetical protein
VRYKLKYQLQPFRIPAGWIVQYNELYEVSPIAIEPDDAVWLFGEDSFNWSTFPRTGSSMSAGIHPAIWRKAPTD